MDQETALEVLDEFIFGNIWNHYTIDESRYAVTWSGGNFLVLDVNSGIARPFRVAIEPVSGYDWTKAIEDQEWEGVEVVEN